MWKGIIAFVLLLGVGLALPAQALETVTLQLKWKHQFQFAGYYAAIEKGFYRDAGLDVRLIEADTSTDPAREVVEGHADFGIGTSALLLARQEGAPVIVLGVIFQHSPFVLLARDGGDIHTVHDLKGRRIMLEPHADELLAYLHREGMGADQVTTLPHSLGIDELVKGKVDAISAYSTNEPYALEQLGISPLQFTPRAEGIDFYGDNLFTTERMVRAHPARVRAFREASLKGWSYAMEHPEEIIDLILTKYSQEFSRAHLQNEARQMIPLIQPVLVEMGTSSLHRWQHIADIYAELGLLPMETSLDGFLYDPDPSVSLSIFEGVVGISGAAILFGLVFLSIALRRNKTLQTHLEERQNAEQELRELLDAAPLPIVITALSDQRVRYANARAAEQFGVPLAEAVGTYVPDFYVRQEDRFRLVEKLRAEGDGHDMEVQMQRRDGSRFWAYVSSGLSDFGGEPVSVSAFSDFTPRKIAEDALRASEQRFRAILQTSPDGISMAELDGRLAFMSDPGLRQLGYEHSEQVIGRYVLDMVDPTEHARMTHYLRDIIRGHTLRTEVFRAIKADGTMFWLESNGEAMRDDSGRASGLIFVTRDVTERMQREMELQEIRRQLERSNSELERVARIDKLTGCWNRRHFEEKIEHKRSHAQRSGRPLSLLLFDIDHFKSINDRHGHSVGDQILCELARVVRENIRATDLLSRWGGEEFAILAPDSGLQDALRLGEKLRAAIEAHDFPEVGEVSISLGVAQIRSGDTVDSWFRRADRALYQAKLGGRNRVEAEDDLEDVSGDPDPTRSSLVNGILQRHQQGETDEGAGRQDGEQEPVVLGDDLHGQFTPPLPEHEMGIGEDGALPQHLAQHAERDQHQGKA